MLTQKIRNLALRRTQLVPRNQKTRCHEILEKKAAQSTSKMADATAAASTAAAGLAADTPAVLKLRIVGDSDLKGEL